MRWILFGVALGLLLTGCSENVSTGRRCAGPSGSCVPSGSGAGAGGSTPIGGIGGTGGNSVTGSAGMAGGAGDGGSVARDAGPACSDSLDLEGCSCPAGSPPRSCYLGAAAQAGIGSCTFGTQACVNGGDEFDTWGACTGSGAATTCADTSSQCGATSDGCGGILDCGTCAGSESCSSRKEGTQGNVCTAAPCVSTTTTCSGMSCGTDSDGCGGVVDCGTCPNGQTCTAGNVCESPCGPGGVFCDGFEDGFGRWTLDNGGGYWTHSTTAFEGAYALRGYWGGSTATGCNITRNATLIQGFDLIGLASATLSFASLTTLGAADSVRVQASSNGGAFSTLGTIGSSNTWTSYSFDLAPYANTTVQIRFQFDNGCPDFAGVDWLVDDVLVVAN